MSDTPKIQLTIKEIDRLLADSPVPTPCDGDVARASRPIPKVTITDEDLALLDETDVEEHLSPIALTLRTANVEADEKVAPITPPRTVWVTSKLDEFPAERTVATPSSPLAATAAAFDVQIEPDPATSHEVVGQLSSSGANSPPPYSTSSESQRRSSLSGQALRWSTMGHSVAGSVPDELESRQHQPPRIFSPLLTQSSKLIADMVSSILSPWSTASKHFRVETGQCVTEGAAGNGDGGPSEDRSCEESLINAFGRIAVADNNLDHDDVFFSPSCELEDMVSRRVSEVRSPQNISLTRALMENTPHESTFMSETSYYSDARSALPSPLKLSKPSSSLPLNQPVPSTPHTGERREFIGESITASTMDIDLTPVVCASRWAVLKDGGGDILNEHRRISVAPSPKRRSLWLETISQESSLNISSTLPLMPEKSVQKVYQECPLSPNLPPSQQLEDEKHKEMSTGQVELIQVLAADAQNSIKESIHDSSQKDKEHYAKNEISQFVELVISEQPLQAVGTLGDVQENLTQPSSKIEDSHPDFFGHSAPGVYHESLPKNELLNVVQSAAAVHSGSHIETPEQFGSSVPQTLPEAEISFPSATSEEPGVETPGKLESSSFRDLPETEFSAVPVVVSGDLQKYISEQPELCILQEVPEIEISPLCEVNTESPKIEVFEESELCSRQEFPEVGATAVPDVIPGDLQMEVVKQPDLYISHESSEAGPSTISTELSEVDLLASAALSVSKWQNFFAHGISDTVTVSVAPALSEGTPLEVFAPFEMTEPLAQTDSIASTEPSQGVSENFTIVMDPYSGSCSEKTQVAESTISARSSQVTKVVEQSNATTISLSETPKPALAAYSDVCYGNGSQFSANRTTDPRRSPSSHTNGCRPRSGAGSALQEEQAIAPRQSIGSSFTKASNRRLTITLENPSSHLSEASLSLSKDTNLEIQCPDVPHRTRSSEPAPDDLAGAEDKEYESSFNQRCQEALQESVEQAPDTAEPSESLQENKENVSPIAQPIISRRRTTHRPPMLSVPVQPKPTPRRLIIWKPPAVPVAPEPESSKLVEEKARLRQEIEVLREKKDVLGIVLSKYRATFEEAMDHLSRMYFATVSARAQADQEACDARRQAGTLYSVVLESQKRQDRMQETIEKHKTSQEQWIERVEALKEKHSRLLEKGLTYRKYCVNKIQKAVENLEATKTELDKDLSKLRVQNKQLEIKQSSLEASLEQKAKENEELTKICDNLLKNVL